MADMICGRLAPRCARTVWPWRVNVRAGTIQDCRLLHGKCFLQLLTKWKNLKKINVIALFFTLPCMALMYLHFAECRRQCYSVWQIFVLKILKIPQHSMVLNSYTKLQTTVCTMVCAYTGIWAALRLTRFFLGSCYRLTVLSSVEKEDQLCHTLSPVRIFTSTYGTTSRSIVKFAEEILEVAEMLAKRLLACAIEHSLRLRHNRLSSSGGKRFKIKANKYYFLRHV